MANLDEHQILTRESPSQFENRIMPRVYIMYLTGSTMYEKAQFSWLELACDN